MDRDEIVRTIDSFPYWLNEFDLGGVRTPAMDKKSAIRFPERKDYFIDPLVRLLGGSLRGKRVLDVGCNNGYYSLLAIEAGCEFVMGIDGRQMHVDQANFVFKAKGIDPGRYQFECSNIFDVNLEEFGSFDVVLCLGVFHHFSKQMQFLENVARVNSDILLLETRVSRIPGPYMVLMSESTAHGLNALDHSLTMLPTKQAVVSMVRQFDYDVVILRPQARHRAVEPDYRLGRRRAILCSRKTNLADLSAEVETLGPYSELKDICVLGAHWLNRRRRRTPQP